MRLSHKLRDFMKQFLVLFVNLLACPTLWALRDVRQLLAMDNCFGKFYGKWYLIRRIVVHWTQYTDIWHSLWKLISLLVVSNSEYRQQLCIFGTRMLEKALINYFHWKIWKRKFHCTHWDWRATFLLIWHHSCLLETIENKFALCPMELMLLENSRSCYLLDIMDNKFCLSNVVYYVQCYPNQRMRAVVSLLKIYAKSRNASG